MDPVVYDFAINEHGSVAALLTDADRAAAAGYYQQSVPRCLRQEARNLTPRERTDLQQFTQAARHQPEFAAVLPTLLDRLLPSATAGSDTGRLDTLLDENGFDRVQHEQIRADLRGGRIGLAMNRLPPTTKIEDVPAESLFDASTAPEDFCRQGEAALRAAKSRSSLMPPGWAAAGRREPGSSKGSIPSRSSPDVIGISSTSTSRKRSRCRGRSAPSSPRFHHELPDHAPIERFLRETAGDALDRTVWLSPGRSIGLRLVPTVRDLQFACRKPRSRSSTSRRKKCAKACARR